MAVRCPKCNCGHCPGKGPSLEKSIVYRGRKRIFQRRRRVCAHCEHVFYTREFHEDSSNPPGSSSNVNPLFVRGDDRPPADTAAPTVNPFLKGPET